MAAAHASTQWESCAQLRFQEDVIRQIYQDIKVKKLPLKVFLLTGKIGRRNYHLLSGRMNYGVCRVNTNDTLYIIYVSTKHPFLGDFRCDD